MTQQPTIRQILEAPAASRDRYIGATATADELLARQSRAPLSTADLAASASRPAASGWGAAGSDATGSGAAGWGATGSDAAGSGAATDGAPAPSAQPDVRAPAPQPAALFERNDAERFRGRWTDVQAAFVDDPRQAVQQADGLVADLMQMLATRFADEKAHLETDWSRGDEISTEDLRVAFRHYRAFFDRLLSL